MRWNRAGRAFRKREDETVEEIVVVTVGGRVVLNADPACGLVLGAAGVAGLVIFLEHSVLFEVGQEGDPPGVAIPGAGRTADTPGGEGLLGVVMIVEGKADLLEVVLTLQACGRLADLLDGGQE